MLTFDQGNAEQLRAFEFKKSGKSGTNVVDALIKAANEYRTAYGTSVPQIKRYTISALSETEQTIKSSGGRVYAIQVYTPTGGNDDVIVSLRDNAVNRIKLRAAQVGKSTEVLFMGENFGCEFTTTITIYAKKSVDDSTNLDAADRPEVVVYYS